jgi:glycosyltransferase involved in cell wall biosynthesis
VISAPATTNAGDALTIVVPCLGEYDLLDRFLASVAERLPGTEVVVVDMGDREPSPQPRLDVRSVASEPRSIAGAKNLGLRHATRPYVALMDSDNVLIGDAGAWAASLGEALADGPDLVTLGRCEDSRRLPGGVAPTRWNFSRHTIGWSVIWRRVHIERLGGFDERFGTGSLAGCGEDFPPLYRHFADRSATTRPLMQLGVGHPSLQRPVSPDRLYRYTYGSAISTVVLLRQEPSLTAAFWAGKTVLGFGADLVRGLRRRDPRWTAVVLRARALAIADGLRLGQPRRVP